MKSNLFSEILVFLFSILSFLPSLGQEIKVDTLKGKSYIELFKITNNRRLREDKDKVLKYLIQKAKKEGNRKFLAGGYHAMAIIHKEELMLKYCDSIIQLTKDTPDENFPLEAYQLIGDNFYEKKKYKEALDNYLIVKDYANQFKNDYQIFHSNYNIGTIKRLINEYKSALELFNKNYSYAKRNKNKLDSYSYLISLQALANIYNDMGESDSASVYNKIGIKESKRLNDEFFFNHFSLNEGVSYYYQGKYEKAIDSIGKYTHYFENQKTKDNLSLAYYYSGKSFAELKKYEKAILFFKRLDTVFQIRQNIFPFTRSGYEYLINYYKENDDFKNQLLYINKLLKVDSILHTQEIYLNKKVLKEYDIPKLENEKEVILQQLKVEKNHSLYIIYITFFVVLLLGSLVYYQSKKRKVYKKRFEKLLKDNSETSFTKVKEVKQNKIEIPESIVNEVMKSLEEFEQEHKYISSKITLAKLAKEINTNTQYLSKVINYYKGKTFSNYLNELRINYITTKLKSDSYLRKFTIKAISEEAGFNNAESFSKAFYKVNGIKPSYFLQELDKM